MKPTRKLHPKRFKVNEAWIAFRINTAPVRTEQDGDFHCLAIMDAASCFILAMEMLPIRDPEASGSHFVQLLRNAQTKANCLPEKLYLATGSGVDALAPAVTGLGLDTIQVPESDLLIFIGDAKQGFSERFESTVQ
jgi:hypothetical protein